MTSVLQGACLIAQSGGPTAVANAGLYGLIRTALDCPEVSAVYGAANGLIGVLSSRLYDLSKEDKEELRLLMQTPSSELGSCRFRLAAFDMDATDYYRILETFRRFDVRYFFYAGGSEALDACRKIDAFLQRTGYDCRVVYLPKTIDNNLLMTDHCPGYPSAAKYLAASVAEVYKDCHVYNTGSITIFEIMGKHSGWLAASSALAGRIGCGPDLIYLPERDFDMEQFLEDVGRIYKENGNCMIAVSEGLHYADGSLVSEAKSAILHESGYLQPDGLADLLAAVIRARLGVKVRGIDFSLLQRCGAHLASRTDAEEAFRAGQSALGYALEGRTGIMISLARDTGADGKYLCRYEAIPLEDVPKGEKHFPDEWITPSGSGIEPAFFDYIQPLLQGEPDTVTENGLPRFARLKKIFAEK